MRTEVIGDATLILGNCRDALDGMIAAGVQYDACVTDPPYELTSSARSTSGFMGKRWDGTGIAFDVDMWRQVYDCLKPGAHLAAFGGTRTSHRMVCAIENAGFEIRDTLAWIFGTGFPKSHNIGQGRGTALKPCHEPIVLARKPLIGTVVQNVLAHGTGALNIDACRVPTQDDLNGGAYSGGAKSRTGASGIFMPSAATGYTQPSGRWPGNLIHDGSDEVMEAFAAFGESTSGGGLIHRTEARRAAGYALNKPSVGIKPADSGTAARFFYSAKAGQSERWTHCAQCAVSYPALGNSTHVGHGPQAGHPTVKPLSLMRWLVTLITPPGGRVLDPFAGTGSTLVAAREAGFVPVGIEKEPDYFVTISERLRRQSDLRVKAAYRQPNLFIEPPALSVKPADLFADKVQK